MTGQKGETERRVRPLPVKWTGDIPRVVRCNYCADLAREEIREQVSDGEVVVRYGCPSCRRRQTRHFYDSDAA